LRYWILVLLLLPGALVAEIYKWTDSQGRVRYGDRPGSGSAQTVTTDTRDRGLGLGADASREQQRLLQALDEERHAEGAARAEAAQEAAKRERNCAYARDRLRVYRNARYLYEPQADGDRRVLSEQERAAARARAEQQVRQWCTQ
jgi:hypothetical protein